MTRFMLRLLYMSDEMLFLPYSYLSIHSSQVHTLYDIFPSQWTISTFPSPIQLKLDTGIPIKWSSTASRSIRCTSYNIKWIAFCCVHRTLSLFVRAMKTEHDLNISNSYSLICCWWWIRWASGAYSYTHITHAHTQTPNGTKSTSQPGGGHQCHTYRRARVCLATLCM